MSDKIKEFNQIQIDLLQHKYNYYVLAQPTISDYDYALLEKKSFEMAKELGYRADSWLDAEENEKKHVHWMVGYDDHHPLSKKIKKK